MSIFTNIWKVGELRSRLLFTLGMVAIYRVGIFVTTPGVDRNAMRHFVGSQSSGFLGLFNLFSGGALEQASIFALGTMPYVSSSIILSLMAVVVPQLIELRKEGEAGQRKINQYTRYGAVILSVFQGMGLAMLWEGWNAGASAGDIVPNPGWNFRLITILSLTTGTAFIMWLGEQISERGLGNGISVIIFAGIVANIPSAMMHTSELAKAGQLQPIDIMLIAGIAMGVTGVIVFFERAQRRLPITYARRMAGSHEMFGGQQTHLPLRVNMAGVVPPIFASSLLMFPSTLQNVFGDPTKREPGILKSIVTQLHNAMQWLHNTLSPGSWTYALTFVALTVFFSFFYTAITFQPIEVAENLKKQNAFIPGVRPGKATADFIDAVLTRITAAGALYIALVCTVPMFLQVKWNVPFYLGGTSLMIVVGVALDLAQQVDSYLISRQYEGLAGGGPTRIRSRGI